MGAHMLATRYYVRVNVMINFIVTCTCELHVCYEDCAALV